jgi:ribose/xylose/arabinose/galactoside ABC-type transport system permease subunit
MVISATFIIGAALAAVAGVMWAANYGTVQHTMGFLPGLKAFTAAVLGGIGNLAGAVVGGMLLGLIEAIGAGYLGELTGGVLGSHYADIFAFVALILVLTLRPLGPAGRTRGRPGLREPHDEEQARRLPRLRALALLALPLVAQQFGQGWVRIMALALLYVLLALGLNIVVGYAGLLDLGYVAFYAVGAYMYALLAAAPDRELRVDRADVPERAAHADLGGHPAGRGCWPPGRRAAGHAGAEAARRLPGHRHAGLRRDHPRVHEQPRAPGQHHQRAARAGPHRLDEPVRLQLRQGASRCSGFASRR